MIQSTILPTQCWCGIQFAIPEELKRRHDEDGYAIYCPLGHSCVRKESEAQKLRKELDGTKLALSTSELEKAYYRRKLERCEKKKTHKKK